MTGFTGGVDYLRRSQQQAEAERMARAEAARQEEKNRKTRIAMAAPPAERATPTSTNVRATPESIAAAALRFRKLDGQLRLLINAKPEKMDFYLDRARALMTNAEVDAFSKMSETQIANLSREVALRVNDTIPRAHQTETPKPQEDQSIAAK